MRVLQTAKAHELGRVLADLAQFPRPGRITDHKRRLGIYPWEMERLTSKEASGGSLFGFGLIDNPFVVSEGENRSFAAFAHNSIRAYVRERMDAGATDGQIRDEITANAAAIVQASPTSEGRVHREFLAAELVPLDIQRRFPTK